MLWLNVRKDESGQTFSLTDNGKSPEDTELLAKADLAFVTENEDFYTFHSKTWSQVKGYKSAGEAQAVDPKGNWTGLYLKVNVQKIPVRKGRTYKGQVGADTPQLPSHQYISGLIQKYGLVGKVVHLKKLFLDTKEDQRTKYLLEGKSMTGDEFESNEQQIAVSGIYESLYLQATVAEKTEENSSEYDELLLLAKKSEEEVKTFTSNGGKSYAPTETYAAKLKAKEEFFLKNLPPAPKKGKAATENEVPETIYSALAALGFKDDVIVQMLIELSKV